MFESLYKVCDIRGDIGETEGRLVPGVLAFLRDHRSGFPHDEAAGREQEEHDEDEELGIECSSNKTVPFDLQQIHDDILNQIQML